jgi:hypothetical protein
VASLAKTFPWLASVLASKTEREVDSGRSSLALSKRLDRDWWLLKMSEDYLAQQPTAMWNPARGVWEKPTENLLCEHWELFSETWPTSGMTRDGQVFELPMRVRLMPGSESLLLRSPKASEGQGGALGEAEALKRGNTVGVRDQIMDLVASQGAKVSRTEVNDLIPTPTTRDHKDGQAEHERDGVVQTDTVARAIFNSGEVLLPTTRTSMANGPTRKEIEAGNPKTRIETEVMLGDISWGKFEPAIRRWEQTLGRPAPAPTKPDGKDGAHRLSSKFTEWMMGLPDGWITNCGLTRNEELKACGNGVVPQQAELALRHLLEGIPLPTGGGQVNLPTPTVSDTFTDNLSSTQQKDGSMHSVTLPQAVRMIP